MQSVLEAVRKPKCSKLTISAVAKRVQSFPNSEFDRKPAQSLRLASFCLKHWVEWDPIFLWPELGYADSERWTVTLNEHSLMISMFTKQARQIRVLSDVLKSRGILVGDDLEAFTDVVDSDPQACKDLCVETVEDYMATFKNLGLKTETEKQPQWFGR
jgi:hypothetical protein